MLDLYRNIKKRRNELGLTQSELAKRMGYADKSMIAKIENGKVDLQQSKIVAFAKALNTTPGDLMGWKDNTSSPAPRTRIPLLAYVAAGIPIDAIEDLLGYEDITEDMARRGEYFALKIKGDSMAPKIMDGDVVIVRSQPDAETGDIVIVQINGDSATCKRLQKYTQGITLVSINPAYEPMHFSNEEVENLPVVILGKVEEGRRKY